MLDVIFELPRPARVIRGPFGRKGGQTGERPEHSSRTAIGMDRTGITIPPKCELKWQPFSWSKTSFW